MTSKVLGVCGGSYWSADVGRTLEGTHFTQLLSNKIGYEYCSLARPGLSNFAIRLQIAEMIKRKVDFVIFGNSTEGRIEVPLVPDKNRFDRKKGIHNISYDGYPVLGKDIVKTDNVTTVSETLKTLTAGNKNDRGTHRISNQQRISVKSYLIDLFDKEERIQKDIYYLCSGVQALEDAKIPYLFIPNDDWVFEDSYYELRSSNLRFVKDWEMKPITYATDHLPMHVIYHTTPENQVVLFNKIYEYILGNNLLTFNQ